MRYMVITSKHHDGFSMYDTKMTDYDIVDGTPFGRDVIAELAEDPGSEDGAEPGQAGDDLSVRVSATMLGHHLPQRLLEHRERQKADHAGMVSELHELDRRDPAQLRVLPPGQRLEGRARRV